ncbi:hypothetical protein AM500_24265 [Bacillus sp. FJAT-18017]|uniref:glycosyltransferase family 2 protein n=1 Tax=Bacillus sp. FJAT-18017 TaxID=1705566 RepID=UPI0006B046FF|nr:glycosyltransferase family A protein [Bacillus sp. FJAT-18017]ALC92528.1 hypothetical protein AM500_24265 [Bacillus sp. FJAT-18017]
MISVIICTNRGDFLQNILSNFKKQSIKDKELILIVNSSTVNLNNVQQDIEDHHINKYELLQFPDQISLGECLNKGVHAASFEYIGKMDDDDYYSPTYLKETYETLVQTKADVVGKGSFYIYFKRNHELRLYNPKHENLWIVNNGSNQYKSSYFLSGGTLTFKKDVIKRVPFPAVNIGEDSGFQQKCFEQGMKMYSSSKENYAYIRHSQPKHHHSDVTEDLLKRRSVFTAITRSPGGFFKERQ